MLHEIKKKQKIIFTKELINHMKNTVNKKYEFNLQQLSRKKVYTRFLFVALSYIINFLYDFKDLSNCFIQPKN